MIAFLCGTVDEVLGAFLNGTLADPVFAMPGCRRWRWRGGEDVLPVGFAMGCRRGRFGKAGRRVQGAGQANALAPLRPILYLHEMRRESSPQIGFEPGADVCSKCGDPLAPF